MDDRMGMRVSKDTLLASLTDLEVFRGLSERQLEALLRRTERMVFRSGQTIISAGTAGDGAYILVSGDAVVTTRDGSDSEPVIPGSLVGEMAMLTEHEYRITVTAQSSVKAIKLPRTELLALMMADRSLTDHFVHRIASRLTKVALELRRVDELLVLAGETVQA